MPDVDARSRLIEGSARWLLPLAVGAVAWLGSYPPMGDLPLHEGVASLLAHHADRTWAPEGLYELSLGHPQQLAQLAMAAAMLVLPSVVAAKLVVSLSVAGIVASVTRVLRHLGRTAWAAALVAPLALGWLYHHGFIANLAGLAIFGGLLVLLDRFAEAPSPLRSLAAAGAITLAFFAHATAALSAVIVLGVLVIVRRRRVALALSPALMFTVLVGIERWRENIAPTALARAFAEQTLWHTPVAKLRELPTFLAGRYDAPFRLAVVVILALAFIATIHRRVVTQRHAIESRRLVEHRFALAAAALFVAFLAGPYSVNYGAFLYLRFLGPAWICLVAAIAPRRSSVASLLAAVACLTAAVVALVPEIRRADDQQRMLAALYPHIARGSAFVVLDFGKVPRSAVQSASPGQRVLAERGGRALFSFVEYPTSPVRIRPEKRWDAVLTRLYGQPGDLRPATDLDVLRYVVAHVPDAGLWALLEAGFFPDARLVARSGEWLLFESTHAVVPIDAPLPQAVAEASGPTLQERVHAIVKRAAPR